MLGIHIRIVYLIVKVICERNAENANNWDTLTEKEMVSIINDWQSYQ